MWQDHPLVSDPADAAVNIVIAAATITGFKVFFCVKRTTFFLPQKPESFAPIKALIRISLLSC